MKPLKRRNKFSLLYVENDPVVFAKTAKILSRFGYILHVAENGNEGLLLYQSVKPDIVLTEVVLPVMGGIEMVQQIREMDHNAQIVLACDPEDTVTLMAALEAGAQRYVWKPLDEEQLRKALDACVENLCREREYEQMRSVAVALEEGALAVVLTDAAGVIEYASPRYCEILGYDSDEAVGQEIAAVEAGNRFSELYRGMREALAAGKQWQGELPCLQEGGEKWKSLHLVPLRGSDGSVVRYMGVVEDISARKRVEDEIRRLNSELEYRMIQRNAALEASKKELDDFCDAVSHDLRGPLSRLQGFSSVLLEECRDSLDEQGTLYVERISKTCRELKDIIDGLLNLSQLTRRAMVYQEVDLSAQARAVADELAASQPDRSVEFVVAPGVVVKGDAGLLRILLEQLLDNAWKCTGKNPRARVEFGVARSDSKTVYFVRDNGVGFDPKYAGKLFRPFQRIHSGGEFSGVGLGLSAVQRIVQRHGGRIWVEGEVERGATFYFTLN